MRAEWIRQNIWFETYALLFHPNYFQESWKSERVSFLKCCFEYLPRTQTRERETFCYGFARSSHFQHKNSAPSAWVARLNLFRCFFIVFPLRLFFFITFINYFAAKTNFMDSYSHTLTLLMRTSRIGRNSIAKSISAFIVCVFLFIYF